MVWGLQIDCGPRKSVPGKMNPWHNERGSHAKTEDMLNV